MNKVLKIFLDVLRGMVIGIANVIPGVSGGTMMVSMGIYDDIVGSINRLFKSWKDFKKSILTLLPYGIGMLVAIVAFASVITMLLLKFPIPTALFFIGLILGCLPMIWKKVQGKIDVPTVILFLAFMALVIALEIIGQKANINRNLTLTFGGIIISLILGVIGSATMIIPGVSGSMVMMILGYYASIMGVISAAKDSLFAADIKGVISQLGILLPFVVGVVVGILGVAKLISFLLKKYESKTYGAILGLIVASPYAVLSRTIVNAKAENGGVLNVGAGALICGVIALVVGFFIALKLGKEE